MEAMNTITPNRSSGADHTRGTTGGSHYPLRVWIDLENSPHVPFFVPIIQQLEAAGVTVALTARDFAQTLGLVQQAGLNARTVGRQGGSSSIRKSMSLLWRALRLAATMRGEHIDLAIGHGSRGLLLAAKLLRIPTLTLYDYEGASVRLFNRLSDHVMTPDVIPITKLEALGLRRSKHFTYPGLKEDLYVSCFQPDSSIIKSLKLDTNRIIVTIRPPSSTAHYRSEESFRIYDELMRILRSRADVQVVLVPRDGTSVLAQRYTGEPNIIVPSSVVNGLNLLYHSDLMISGGGTMVREAAALGIPAVTIFKGEMGAVDSNLIQEGRMNSIDRAEEILPFLKKRPMVSVKNSNVSRDVIVETILSLARQASGRAQRM